MNIKINLKEDFLNLLKSEMDYFGIRYDKFKSIEYQYLEYSRKRKIPKVKKVHNTPKLFAFYNYRHEINEIINALENNKDLTARLSKSSKNATENRRDDMLNIFNIYHFHLGNKIDEKDSSFVERTGDLLFVYFYENEAYILGIFPHPKQWLSNNWFQIFYNNWPHLCSKLKLNRVKTNENLTNEEIIKLRKNYINTTININGETYIPLGFGITTSGARINDTTLIDTNHLRIKDLESYLIKNLDCHLKKYLIKKMYIDFFSSKKEIEIKIKSIENNNIILSIKNPIMCIEITYIDFFKK